MPFPSKRQRHEACGQHEICCCVEKEKEARDWSSVTQSVGCGPLPGRNAERGIDIEKLNSMDVEEFQ